MQGFLHFSNGKKRRRGMISISIQRGVATTSEITHAGYLK